MKRIVAWFLIMGSVVNVCSQEFGGHPPSQKWRQINTDSIRVIFAPGLEKQAGEIIDITRALNATTLHTIGTQVRKISIVLQNQTLNSNGYVGLGPWRSEFYLTPMQNSFGLGSLPWHKTLALHEYRHVQQYNNFRKGISRVAYTIFGEQALALINSTAVPNYFWEGDAVYQETLKSGQGRGRLPYFYNGYRSLWSAGKSYSWQKLRNGSLRDYVPDHYQLGYLLVAYGRQKYGDSIWARVTDDAVRFRKLFYPWQRAIEKHTGMTYPQFRKAALTYSETQLSLTATDTVTGGAIAADNLSAFAAARKHFAGDEVFPQWITENRVLFVQSDYRKVPAFVIRDVANNKTTRIRIKDISEDQYYSYRNNRIVYAAYLPSTRWGWRDYTSIRMIDINSGRQKIITGRTKYFSPDISGDGKRIVVVEVDPLGKNSLHIIKTDSANQVTILPNLDNLFYTYPKFDASNRNIISAVRNGEGAMTLVSVDIATGNVKTLLPWSMTVIGFPLVRNDTITFSATSRGNDRLFMLAGNKLYELSVPMQNTSTGNYQVSVLNGNYCWSGFSAVGYRLQTGRPALTELSYNLTTARSPGFSSKPDDIDSLKGDEKDLLKVDDRNLLKIGDRNFLKVDDKDFLNADGGGFPKAADRDFLNRVPHNSYTVTRYRKSYNLLNPHSFRPYLSEPDYRFSLIGENVLNTFVSEMYFNYNSNERSKAFGANLNYGGLFPWIRGGIEYTFDRSTRISGRRVAWNEAEANIGLAIPLNLTSGRFYRHLSASSDYVINSRNFKGNYKDSFDNRSFGYLRSAISFSNQVVQARQNIYPRFAQTITLSYSKSVSSLEASQLLASAYWYFPGIFRNHSLVVNTAFQGRDTLRNAGFSNSFPFSRGYIAENYHHMFKVGVNYHLPLVYPDWGFASIIYFQRIRANLFYDFTRINDFTRQRKFVGGNFRSAGTEIFFDTKWWNQQPVSFGIRYSYLLDSEIQGISKSQWELVLPLGLF